MLAHFYFQFPLICNSALQRLLSGRLKIEHEAIVSTYSYFLTLKQTYGSLQTTNALRSGFCRIISMCSVPWVPEEVLEGFCLFSWRSLDGEQEAKARMVRLSLSSPLILSVLLVTVFTH